MGTLLIGCTAPAGRSPDSQSPTTTERSRTLVVAVRAEPPSLARRGLRSLGLTADLSPHMFNADLTVRNDEGVPIPYLAEAVPKLDTQTWKVNRDGTMETRYALKPGIVWHDGQPITADDWVFAYQVYSTPDFGLSSSLPFNAMMAVTAPDPRTVVIQWRSTYPDADGGGQSNILNPLPRHLLKADLESQDPEAFIAHPFWTQDYVGAGAYKLDKWEPGSYLEGVAFDNHVLGKARITRIREVFLSDPNTVLANILAGEAQLTAGDSIRFTDGETLRAQWGDRGSVLNFPNLYRMVQFQLKPEYASTRAFTDQRVRQALANGWDFQPVNETVQGGRTHQAYGPIPPSAAYFPRIEQTVPRHTFDPRKSEQLMQEAGFTRGGDGVWTHSQFGRMAFETNVLANPDSENEMHIMADSWRKLGFDVKEAVWAASIGRDAETRSTFPGLSTTSTGLGENHFSAYQSNRIPTEARRWQGSNRGGWKAPPEYDRLVEVYETSLKRDERIDAIVGMNKIYAEDLPVIPLYFKLNAVAVANGLTGPRLVDPNADDAWNIHEWEFR
jgi:peptide/nickel transport system substrate-binding protein